MDPLIERIVEKNAEIIEIFEQALEKEPELTMMQLRVKLAQKLGASSGLAGRGGVVMILIAAARQNIAERSNDGN